jgi:DNA-binding NtrC family response regulator/tetratricopeptide (TPR) repeat protein/class 3 adenylate cyclase
MDDRLTPHSKGVLTTKRTSTFNCPRPATTSTTTSRSVPPVGHPTDRIIGHSPAIIALRQQIHRLAGFDVIGSPFVPTLLLSGETGTGKGLVARAMHDSGPRAHGPCIEVNCAAIPETLLEAELFGFEAGAFTDAKRAKPGLFEAASGGTLFLDEVEALPLPLQGKLLTAIEAKRVRRLGAVTDHAVDVKLIAATHADLSQQVGEGCFRTDLYHRLAVVLLDVPPLRARGNDVLVLAEHFLRCYAEAHGLPPKRLSGAAEAWLLGYDWPGNVRELGHLMERVTLLGLETTIAPETLRQLCLPRPSFSSRCEPTAAHGDLEPRDELPRIRQALVQAEGNVVRAARLLGMTRSALRYRMCRYGIERPGLSKTDDGQCGRTSPCHGTPHQQTLHQEKEGTPSTNGTPLTQPSNWEQKPVAVLAITITFPEPTEEVLHYEPWTVAARWEQRLVEKVHGFGGVLLQRSPSLLLVAFGIPRTLEQLPQRALHAALAIRQLVSEATESPEKASCPEVRLAVHSGTVLVDTQASDATVRVLPVGEALTLPVRLLGFAALGEILLSAHVGRLLEGWYEIERHDVRLTDEHAEQVRVYSLVGLRLQRSPLEGIGKRVLSRFVGRARELAALRELLSQVEGGRGQVVGIFGEPGVGKSRLLYEFRQCLGAGRVLCLEGDCSSYGATIPYYPVLDLVKASLQLDDHDDEAEIRDKIAGRLHTLDEVLASTLPAFLTLLNVPVDDPQWQVLDPPQRRQRILEALKRLLLCQSQVQPLVLIIENLQWIDSETQAFLDSLIESLPTVRLLLLITYRPEYQHGWSSKTFYTQQRLDPLPRESAQELLQALLGDDTALVPLKQSLIERTEGNPFFLEESIQTLVETQVLVGERGAYRLTRAFPNIQVPATVQAVLAARIDRLPAEERSLLQSAAVIGKDVPLGLLQHIVELPEESLRRAIATLQRTEFLYETRLLPDLEYTFKHALTHEVAYGSLSQERRRTLHARIVTGIEQLYADRLADQVERLAHHAFCGEMWERAMTNFWQAGTKAFLRSANREAAACYERALTALQHLPESRETHEQAIDLRSHLGNALVPLGEFRRILDCLREAEPRAEALGDQRRLARVLSFMAFCVWMTGDHERAVTLGRRALGIAETLQDFPLQVRTNFYVGQAYHALGDYRRAIGVLRGIMDSLEGELGQARLGMAGLPSVFARTWLVWCLAELGDFTEGIAGGEEGVRIAEAVDHPFSLAVAYGGLGFVYLYQRDLQRAIPVLEQGLAVCETRYISVMVPWLSSMLGAAYALAGRLVDAQPLLEQAIEQATAMNILGRQALQVAWLGEVHLLAGRLEEALVVAQCALRLSRAHQERGHEAWTLRLLGEIAYHRDPPRVEQAEGYYSQAFALAEELGMQPLLAHCHLGLGRLYRGAGRLEEARAELSTTIALCRDLGMTFWPTCTEAELAKAL